MARQTKADRILNDAAMRLEAARINERTAQSQLNTAKATLAALQEAYDALEKELAPQPRKKAGQSQPAQAAPPTGNNERATPKTERSADPCVYQYPKDSPVNPGMVCGEFFENGIHDKTMGYAGYHPFVQPAQTAAKKSRRKPAAASSTANTEIEKGAAMSASGD